MIEGLLPDEGGHNLLMRLEKLDGLRLRTVGSSETRCAGRRVVLLVGLLKSEQFDAALRAAAELGVYEMFPLLCERSVPRLSAGEFPKKMARWRRILDEGSKVSGYPSVTKLREPILPAALEWSEFPEARYAAFLSSEARPISEASGARDVAFAVGPEGDWTEGEVSLLLENNFRPVGLGAGVLRSSTAVIVGCGWFRLS
jgi:16S rRNA (uracil1498-N3)-methyltransferase